MLPLAACAVALRRARVSLLDLRLRVLHATLSAFEVPPFAPRCDCCLRQTAIALPVVTLCSIDKTCSIGIAFGMLATLVVLFAPKFLSIYSGTTGVCICAAASWLVLFHRLHSVLPRS